MPCSPSDNSILPIVTPPVSLPGFGIPTYPVQVPLGDFDIPDEIMEDVLGLIQTLGALFPSGLFKGLFDLNMKNVLGVISNILSQIAPFLSLYNFFMALLNMISCVIEVLCAIPNPFKLIAALKKLFSQCLPPFLNMFPFLALIAMIIALLLLILALITFIIETVNKIMKELIQNILDFSTAIAYQNPDATLAIAQKIAALLCFMNNLFSVFIGLSAAFAIIQSLASLAGFAVCSDGSTDGCCTDDVCPPFIKEGGITGKLGELIYHSGLDTNLALIFPSVVGIDQMMTIPALRTERWEFINGNSAGHQFSDIITPLVEDGNIFYPDINFDKTTAPPRAPYTVDLRMRVDPIAFNSFDTHGIRFIRIKDCIVVRKPYIGLVDFQSNLGTSSLAGGNNGTLNLEGGKVFEDDGVTKYIINGEQATLNTFLSRPVTTVGSPLDLPSSDDGIYISNIEFSLKPGYASLADSSLITIGCIPDVAIERNVLNAVLTSEDLRPVFEKIGALPDILGAQTCVQNALNDFRKNVSAEGAAIFQSTVETCLNDLKGQTLSTVCAAINGGVSQFKSEVLLDTDVQFTTRNITVSIVLKDPGGTVISNNIPTSCADSVKIGLKGTVTLGEISDFEYDGTQKFIAHITSKEAGNGALTVAFDNKQFSHVIQATATTNSSIVENILDYIFVDATIDSVDRRDESDIAENS